MRKQSTRIHLRTQAKRRSDQPTGGNIVAKLKEFAVELEITLKRTVFITARKEGGAATKALSEDGWNEATVYWDEDDLRFERTNAKVISVKEVS